MRYLKFLIILCFSIPCFSQSKGELPTQAELSSKFINCLAEDKDGYLWIGTNRGLNRYNGSVYKLFEQNGEDTGLMNNIIISVYPDEDGTIWVGSSSGLNAISNGVVRQDVRVKEGIVYSITPYDNECILFSTREKIYLLNKKTLEYRIAYEDPRITFNNIHFTKDGYIWINNLVLPIIYILDNSFNQIGTITLTGDSITGIQSASDNSVTVLTNKGLHRYSSSGKELPLSNVIKHLTQGKHILFFYDSLIDERNITIGIKDEGIYNINLNNEQTAQLWDKEKLKDILSAQTLATDYGLWLSENSWGLKLLNLRNSTATIAVPSINPSEALNKFYSYNDSTLLILTNKQIYFHDLNTHRSTRIFADGITGDEQLGISTISKNGHLWICVNQTELREYIPEKRAFRLRARYNVEYSNAIWSLPNGAVQLVQSDKILTFEDNGVVSQQVLSSPPPAFWYCGQRKFSTPYMLSDRAVYMYDIISGQIEQLEIEIEYPSAVYEDNNGVVWIGSKESGVLRFDPYDKSTVRYGKEQGLSELNIRSIDGDNLGNIWIASGTQVACISNEEHITLYNSPPNIFNQFNTNSSLALSNGHVLFGSMDLIVDYSSNHYESNDDFELELDGVLINGSNIVPIPDNIILKGSHNQFSFFYSIYKLGSESIPQYEYMLEGHDKKWIIAGQSNRAAYSGIAPGRYSFKLRSQLPSGDYIEKILVKDIHIKPLALLSIPAILFYILAALALSWFLIRQNVSMGIARQKLELAQQEKLLNKQINEEKINFFSNVSHEFRTPLSLIYGPIKELSEKDSLSEDEKDLVSIVLSNSERLLKLSNQLLNFDKEEKLQELSVMHTNISELISKMLENFSYMLSQKSIILETDIDENCEGWCDKEKVERILFNLISNSIKYTPEQSNGHIVVRLIKSESQTISISVEDNGIGISDDKRNKLFLRYERLGAEIEQKPNSGFGIGLNYSQHLAHLHKGEIIYTPNSPKGSIFTFSFPSNMEAYDNVWEEESVADNSANTVMESGHNGVSVLIAEDNPDMREYLRKSLSKYYNVTTANDGAEAWNCMKLNIPDLVVSDVVMPYKDGFALCKDIKDSSEYCHIPVILLTAKADMKSTITGLDLGADAYISKPFESSHLLSTIRNLIQNRQRIQHLLFESTEKSFDKVEADEIKPKDKAFLEKMYNILNEHLSDEEFGVSILATEIGMSRTSVFSKIKNLTGESPQSFITNYRLNKAMELLKTHEMNISEVAYSVGFSTLTGFSRSFKNKFGVPPSTI